MQIHKTRELNNKILKNYMTNFVFLKKKKN